KQSRRSDFRFGVFLKNALENRADGGALRFRRLLDSRDLDDLDHRMRGLLRLTCADRARVDWGDIGIGMLQFFKSRFPRREWAQDFYAPDFQRPNQTDKQTRDQA